jgi:hypothetical protein
MSTTLDSALVADLAGQVSNDPAFAGAKVGPCLR